MLGVVGETPEAYIYLGVRPADLGNILYDCWVTYEPQGNSPHPSRGLSTITMTSGGLNHRRGSGIGSRPKAKDRQQGAAIGWSTTRSVPTINKALFHSML